MICFAAIYDAVYIVLVIFIADKMQGSCLY